VHPKVIEAKGTIELERVLDSPPPPKERKDLLGRRGERSRGHEDLVFFAVKPYGV
jgi:hypothetical protein